MLKKIAVGLSAGLMAAAVLLFAGAAMAALCFCLSWVFVVYLDLGPLWGVVATMVGMILGACLIAGLTASFKGEI